MQGKTQMSKTFIVSLWERIFYYLQYVSIFKYIREIKFLKNTPYAFVELWVIGSLIAAFISMILIRYVDLPVTLVWCILAYSFIRVFEIIVYQVNVLLFDQLRNPVSYQLRSYRRLVILLLHNYLEVILWFATSYMILSYSFEVLEQKGNIFTMLLFSFKTMVTFGSGIEEFTSVGHCAVIAQAIIGLFMTLICLARFIGLLPKPETMDDTEKEVAVSEEKVDNSEELLEHIKELEKKIELLTLEVKK